MQENTDRATIINLSHLARNLVSYRAQSFVPRLVKVSVMRGVNPNSTVPAFAASYVHVNPLDLEAAANAAIT